jgi:hypothetical protein
VVSSSLTSVGTIATGTWQGSVIVTTYGGTGLASWTTGDVPYYNSGTALNKLNIGAANTVLTSSSTAPQWSTSLTLAGSLTAATGVTVSSGGITVTGNSTITGTLGGITTLTATTLAGTLSTASQPNVTTMAGLTAATALASVGTITSGTWQASVVTTTYGGTGLASYTTGDLLYFNSGTAFNKLGIGAANTVAVSTGSAPSWSTSLNLSGAITAGGLLTASASLAVTGGITYTTTVTSTTNAATPSAFVGTQSTSFASTTLGNAQMGYGSTYDVSLLDRAGTVALGIGPNSTAVTIPGLINGQQISATANFTGSVAMGALTATTGVFSGALVTVGDGVSLQNAALILNVKNGYASQTAYVSAGIIKWSMGMGAVTGTLAYELFNNVTNHTILTIASATDETTFGYPVTLSSTLLVQSTVRFSTYGAGAATFDASGNITSVSDERHKTDIRPFTRGLSDLLGLKPITYKFNQLSGLEMAHDYSGFSAQNVQAFIPEAVMVGSDGILSFSDRPVLAACVNAIQSLDDRLSRLEQRAA